MQPHIFFYSEQMMSRTGLEDYTAAIGIGEGATVKLRSDDKHEGEIDRQNFNFILIKF